MRLFVINSEMMSRHPQKNNNLAPDHFFHTVCYRFLLILAILLDLKLIFFPPQMNINIL